MRNLHLREAVECPKSHSSQVAEQGLNPTKLDASLSPGVVFLLSPALHFRTRRHRDINLAKFTPLGFQQHF